LENIYDRILANKIGGANDNNYKGDPLEDIKNAKTVIVTIRNGVILYNGL